MTNVVRSHNAINPSASVGNRTPALRFVADLLVTAADEAPSRDSALRLRDASARVFDAIAIEKRSSLQ